MVKHTAKAPVTHTSLRVTSTGDTEEKHRKGPMTHRNLRLHVTLHLGRSGKAQHKAPYQQRPGPVTHAILRETTANGTVTRKSLPVTPRTVTLCSKHSKSSRDAEKPLRRTYNCHACVQDTAKAAVTPKKPLRHTYICHASAGNTAKAAVTHTSRSVTPRTVTPVFKTQQRQP